MAEVIRRPLIVGQIAGTDSRLRHSEIVTGARRRGPVAPWTGLPLVNSWNHLSGEGDASPAYVLDERGVVWLRGRVENNSDPHNQLIATLPEGYRPAQTLRRLVPGRGGYWNSGINNYIWVWDEFTLWIGTDGKIEERAANLDDDGEPGRANLWLDLYFSRF